MSTLARTLRKSRTSGIRRGQEFLVLLPTAMILGLLAVRAAPGVAIDVLTFAAVLVLAFRSRMWAATLATAGLFAVGAFGIKWALTWHGASERWYGGAQLGSHSLFYVGLEGAVLPGRNS